MVFIHHEKKAVFIHNPKCGGAYVRDVLLSDYGFQPFATEKHANLADFMDTPDQIDPVVNDKHTIRKQGKVRYFLSHQATAGQQDVFRDYFKFAFVRNPYARLVSAYKYCKNNLLHSCPKNPHIRGLAENPDCYTDFNTFVLRRQQVNNIAFFHAFVTQSDQLVDDTGAIPLDYIGRTENLDEDFLHILEKIGLDEIKHGNLLFFDQKINQTADETEDITLLFDEETLAFTNRYFRRDFDAFGYPLYESLAEFRENYLRDTTGFSSRKSRKDFEIIKYGSQLQTDLLKKYGEVMDTLMDIIVTKKNTDAKILDMMQDTMDLMNEKRIQIEEKLHDSFGLDS